MTVPPITYEHSIATLWIDDYGILHALAKPGPMTIQSFDGYFAFVQKLIGGKRVRIITEVTNASPMDAETRKYVASRLPDLFSAMAIVSESHIGLLKGKTFIELGNQPYPTALFENENDALVWIRNQVV